jgi:hypothetical protein
MLKPDPDQLMSAIKPQNLTEQVPKAISIELILLDEV